MSKTQLQKLRVVFRLRSQENSWKQFQAVPLGNPEASLLRGAQTSSQAVAPFRLHCWNSWFRSKPGRFKGGHQKEDVLAEQPEAFQVDYELDPPVLFSINPDDNRGLLGGFKSLAEELMDATEQPMNQQPLNQHLVLVSQPAPENPSPRSIGKVKNGCVLDKQIFEEIEMIAPTAGEAILEVTSPEDYRDSNIK
ncbi:UNVERIFIED_CONTAM: hypothetical protein K2H54_045825 [Gekko kuhli]